MNERTYTADEVDAMIARAVNAAKQAQLSELFGNPEQLEFAELIRADEREACAKVCDEYDVAEDVNSCDTAEGIAAAIRARGNT
jgi:hypothetical protein